MNWMNPAAPAAIISTFALNIPTAAADVYSVSNTTPHARPSGNGCCSSLMNRRFIGNATSTPKMLSTTLNSSI